MQGLYAKYRFDYKQPLGLDTTEPFTTLDQYRAIRGSKISDASKANEADTISRGGLGYHNWCAYECMRFQLEGQGLDDSMGCDAFLRLSWITDISWNNEKNRNDLTTEKIWENRADYKTSIDPVWEPFTLTREMFLRGDAMPVERRKAHLVLLEVYDYDRFSRDDLIGQNVLTLDKLYSLKAGDRLELEHPRRRRRLRAKGEMGLDTSGVVKVKAVTKQSGAELTNKPLGCSSSVWKRLQSADRAVCYEQYQQRVREKSTDHLGVPRYSHTVDDWEKYRSDEKWQLEYLYGEMDGLELSFSYARASPFGGFVRNEWKSFRGYKNWYPVARVPHRTSKSFDARSRATPEGIAPIDYPFDEQSFRKLDAEVVADPVSSCVLDAACSPCRETTIGNIFIPLDAAQGGLPDGDSAIVLSFYTAEYLSCSMRSLAGTYPTVPVLSAVTSVNDLLRMKRGHDLTFVAGLLVPVLTGSLTGNPAMIFSASSCSTEHAGVVILSVESVRRVRRARWSDGASLKQITPAYRHFVLEQRNVLANRSANYWRGNGQTLDFEGLRENQDFCRREREKYLAQVKADGEEAARRQKERARQDKIKAKENKVEARRAAAEASAMRKIRAKQRAKEAAESKARDKAAQRERRERESREAKELKKRQKAEAIQREAERIAKLQRDEPIHRRWENEARAIVQPLMIRT